MGIVLYKHNFEAYRKALSMLDKCGKAAIIHPTGTGKSMIGFKLAEDNRDKNICWLSPSEYIYRTQIDNLKNSCEDYEPDNISFFTYAKLSNLTGNELESIKPDYIVLDEFHRCGAEVWGTGVEKLLSCYPDVPLLGLSATAIRYLDNCRDMADELFDGNVASEMTLGEAIVRGILNPPKYELSIYSYRDSLLRYEKRIAGLHYEDQRKKAYNFLEELRRALDMAEGLDVIFDRHMTDKTGKYIVFCSGYEAMQEAILRCGEWFGKIDPEPHIYSVYSEDSASDSSFTGFKEDSDSTHLRLLFCIDALNEGIHVKDVAGVILLRPTVSPIVFKQQIGRALSASKDTKPVIFDIVNNIENLYSIDAVREEMEVAVSYMHYADCEAETVNESFEIISEVRNCLELFDKLEGVLTSSWDTMYMEAKQYFEKNGNLNIEQGFVSQTGYPVGRWLATQRTNRRKGDPSLDAERIARLDAIGMDWNYAAERHFNKGYEKAKAYYIEHGNLDVPAAYDTEDGFHLGSWCRMVRNRYQEGRLAEGYVEALENIGMQWDQVFSRKWDFYMKCAGAYYEKNGDLNVPIDYVCGDDGRRLTEYHLHDSEDGTSTKRATDKAYRLGIWISTQRDNYAKGRLSKTQIAELEKLHMSWDRRKSRWDKGFEYALRYIREHGDINSVPAGYKYDDFNLANWIRAQRTSYNTGKMAKERIISLEAAGLIWNPQEALWEKGYIHAKDYVRTHGNIDVPPHYVCEDGYKLKNWLVNQGTRYKTGRMSETQQERLEALGMTFDDRVGKTGNMIA